jgi:predicted RNase H-like HicB family nuclease
MTDTIIVSQMRNEAVGDTASMSIPDATRLYSMLLEWDPRDAIYVVTVPELPGCRTHGRTRAEAVAQAQDAIEGWLGTVHDAGEPIPAPHLFIDCTDDVDS